MILLKSKKNIEPLSSKTNKFLVRDNLLSLDEVRETAYTESEELKKEKEDRKKYSKKLFAVLTSEESNKDLGIVLDQARALTFPLPMAAAAHQLFLAAAANGQGLKDESFVIRVWEQLAGIRLPGKN